MGRFSRPEWENNQKRAKSLFWRQSKRDILALFRLAEGGRVVLYLRQGLPESHQTIIFKGRDQT